MRLDVYLAENGFAKSRQRAKELIKAGQVFVNGKQTDKPSYDVNETFAIKIEGEQLAYVGRGGLKLEKAIKEFGIRLENRVCIDVGASTGGFTDCMLQNGAAFVYAVDVGHGQLDRDLAGSPRVKNMEGTNILELSADDFPECPDLISVDVSFVSLKNILPKIYELTPEHGEAVTLIKPQFEAGRAAVGKGGIVRDRRIHEKVLEDIIEFAGSIGFAAEALTFSPVQGGDGNIEYLAYFKKGKNFPVFDIRKTVSSAFETLK